MKKVFSTFLIVCGMMTAFSFAGVPIAANADIVEDINENLEPIQEVYDEDEEIDSRTFVETVANIIKIVLGFLGVIFVVLIIYAGFLWMLSAGNEDKIAKAKSIMVSAIIGVAIIFLAYAITAIVISTLADATGAGN